MFTPMVTKDVMSTENKEEELGKVSKWNKTTSEGQIGQAVHGRQEGRERDISPFSSDDVPLRFSRKGRSPPSPPGFDDSNYLSSTTPPARGEPHRKRPRNGYDRYIESCHFERFNRMRNGLQKVIDNLRERNEKLTDLMIENRKEIAQQHIEIAKMSEEIRVSHNMKHVEGQKAETSEKLEAGREESGAAYLKLIRTLEKEVKKARDKIIELEQSSRQIQIQSRDWEEQLMTAIRENTGLRSTIEELQKDRDKYQQAAVRENNQLAKIEQLEEALRVAENNRKIETDKNTEEIEKLMRSKQRLETIKNRLEMEKQAMKTEWNNMAAAEKRALEELKLAKDQIKKLEGDLAAVENEKSEQLARKDDELKRIETNAVNLIENAVREKNEMATKLTAAQATVINERVEKQNYKEIAAQQDKELLLEKANVETLKGEKIEKEAEIRSKEKELEEIQKVVDTKEKLAEERELTIRQIREELLAEKAKYQKSFEEINKLKTENEQMKMEKETKHETVANCQKTFIELQRHFSKLK